MGSSVGAVSPELLGVAALPVGTAGGAGLGGGVSALEHATGLLSAGSHTTLFAVAVLGGANPVDAGVTGDGLVGGVDHDDLEELEGGVLTNPVGVEHAEVGAELADTLFSNVLVGLGLLLLDNTVVTGLSENGTLADVALAATATDADAVDNVALGALVAKTAGLVDARGALNLVDHGELTVLPGADTEDESDNIRLLLFPEFFQILVGSHIVI
jgi:hypothetical protein